MNAFIAYNKTPASQLEELQEYVDELNIEQEGEDYILTFKAEGNEVHQLIEEKMKENFPVEEIPEELLNGLTVNDLPYRFVISQNTDYPQSIQIDMDFNIEVNENRTHVTQSLYS